jgi:signal recognition particle receptor subunit beta
MAILDSQHDNIVIRIVYDGPPMAGKTTSVRALANGLGGKVVAPREVGGRTLYFDWLDYTGGLFEGRRIRCQILTVPGQATLASRRRHLLKTADAVVFVGDSQQGSQAAARSYFEGLRRVLDAIDGPPVGIVMQANKRDIPGAVPIDELREMLDTTNLRVAIIESIAIEGSGIREAFVFAVRLALDRVRELMRLKLLVDAPPQHQNADDLLSELHAVEGGSLNLAAESGLKHTPLHEVRDVSSAISALDQALRDEVSAPIKPRPRARHAASGRAPELPFSRLPSGMIWPAVNGRLILHEAIGENVAMGRETNGDWNGSSGHWNIHSPDSAHFETLEDGRVALVEWARLHASSSQVISDQRCVALAQDGNGRFRLWQLCKIEPSLRDQFDSAFAQGAEATTNAIVQVAQQTLKAAILWSDAACWLPLSLRKIGMGKLGPHYIGSMPDPGSARKPERRSAANVTTVLAAELSLALPALKHFLVEILARLERVIPTLSEGDAEVLHGILTGLRKSA